jgi:hypothetical protein
MNHLHMTMGEIYRILSLEGAKSYTLYADLQNHPGLKRMSLARFNLLKSMFRTMERKVHIARLING